VTPGQTFLQVLRFSSFSVILPVFNIYWVTYFLGYSSITDVMWFSSWPTDWQTNKLLKKLTVPQLVKKFPALGTRSFITGLAAARHLSLSWARSIQSTPYTPSFLKTPITIPLFSQVVSVLRFSPAKHCMHISSIPMRATCLVHLNFLEILR
jgi:hypothetical protein